MLFVLCEWATDFQEVLHDVLNFHGVLIWGISNVWFSTEKTAGVSLAAMLILRQTIDYPISMKNAQNCHRPISGWRLWKSIACNLLLYGCDKCFRKWQLQYLPNEAPILWKIPTGSVGFLYWVFLPKRCSFDSSKLNRKRSWENFHIVNVYEKRYLDEPFFLRMHECHSLVQSPFVVKVNVPIRRNFW